MLLFFTSLTPLGSFGVVNMKSSIQSMLAIFIAALEIKPDTFNKDTKANQQKNVFTNMQVKKSKFIIKSIKQIIQLQNCSDMYTFKSLKGSGCYFYLSCIIYNIL